MVEILKTNNYSLFKLNEYNRKINVNHVATLQNKIAANDKTHLNPIIVNSDMEIVDGQHRFHALKKLNKTVHYIIDENFNKSDLIEFNVNQRNWTSDNYLDYYERNGNMWYKEFRGFRDRFNLKFTHALRLFVNDATSPHKMFKSGEIVPRSLQRAYFIAEIIKRLEDSFKSVNIPTVYSLEYLYDFHKEGISWDELTDKCYDLYNKTGNKIQ